MRDQPTFNLYSANWPILTWQFPLPPAKFVHGNGDRQGQALNSLFSSLRSPSMGCPIFSGSAARTGQTSVRVNFFLSISLSMKIACSKISGVFGQVAWSEVSG